MIKFSVSLSAVLLLVAGFCWASGLGDQLAFLLYEPTNTFAWHIREWSNVPILIISVGFLIFLSLPKLKDRHPELRQLAAVWVLVALLGVGLLNQVILKESIQRPRPRESVLVTLNDTEAASGKYTTTAPKAVLKGNSMPSGHAGVAFLLLVPAFVFWERRRKLAISFLIVGSLIGALVSWARMTLGAHFISDLIVAAVINILTAALFTMLIKKETPISALWGTGVILLAGAIIIATKEFKTDLYWQGTLTEEPHFYLPCDVSKIYGQEQTLHVFVEGKGLPETWVYLKQDKNTFRIQRFGFQHHMKCSATWTSPNIQP